MTPADIAVILRRLDEQDRKLDSIEKHVMSLELWKARVLGAVAVTTAIGLPAAIAALT